jgi:hypothetical protein
MNMTEPTSAVVPQYPGPEHRREARFTYRKPIEIIPAPDAAGTPLRCQLLDCSIRGIAIAAPRPLPINTREFLIQALMNADA